MKKRIVLLVCCFSVFSIFAQKRNYLLYTDANISKLKSQIKKNVVVKTSWENQLKKAEALLKKSKHKKADCQLLGLVYRMTGDEKYAKVIKEILLQYTAMETWEGEALLSRTPSWKGNLATSHGGFFISIGYDCIYNYLTKKERKQIAEGLVNVGIMPALNDWLLPESNFHTFDTMGHNWWSACVYYKLFRKCTTK